MSLGVYVLVDPSHVLDAEKAFVSVSLLNSLKVSLSTLPQLINYLAQVTRGGRRCLLEQGSLSGQGHALDSEGMSWPV